MCPAQKIPQGLSTRRFRVRDPPGEPNLSATSFLRLLVNGRQASTPQNGQYLRNKDTLCGRSGLGYSPRMPRRRWFGSTFSDSPARDELLVNGHKAIRVGSGVSIRTANLAGNPLDAVFGTKPPGVSGALKFVGALKLGRKRRMLIQFS